MKSHRCEKHRDITFYDDYCPVCEAEDVAEKLREAIIEQKEIITIMSNHITKLVKGITQNCMDIESNTKMIAEVKDLINRK